MEALLAFIGGLLLGSILTMLGSAYVEDTAPDPGDLGEIKRLRP